MSAQQPGKLEKQEIGIYISIIRGKLSSTKTDKPNTGLRCQVVLNMANAHHCEEIARVKKKKKSMDVIHNVNRYKRKTI